MIQLSQATPYLQPIGTLMAKVPPALGTVAAKIAQFVLTIFANQTFWIVAGVVFTALIVTSLVVSDGDFSPQPQLEQDPDTSNTPNTSPTITSSNTIDTPAPSKSEPPSTAPKANNGWLSYINTAIQNTKNATLKLTGNSPVVHNPAVYPFVEGNLPQPPARITQGCHNLGLTCWFNASLNLLAGTTYFDDLLNTDFTNAGDSAAVNTLRELVPFLKIAVNELRSNRPFKADLARLLRQKIDDAQYMGTTNAGSTSDATVQHDASEFLYSLLSDWNRFRPDNAPLPTMRSEYRPIGHTRVKSPVSKKENSLVQVPITPHKIQYNLPIILHSSIEEKSVATVDSDGGVPSAYRKKDNVDTDATDRLILNVMRTQYDGSRAGNLVHIEFDGTVRLSEQTYAVKAALVQCGGASSGHWYYVEANSDGKFYKHDDSVVTEVPLQDLFTPGKQYDSPREAGIMLVKRGTIFFLEKVHPQVV